MTEPLVGIDLGTSNSLIATLENGSPRLIPNGLGHVLTPSCVSVTDDDRIVVGAAARDHLIARPERAVAAFKRYMGTNREFTLGQRRFRPEELSALILKSLVADAEAHFGQPVTSAVVTVPAYFNDKQRKATFAAGEIAGLRITRLLNEPTAAALSFQLHETRDESKLVVCDLGGGTFDVSVLDIFEGLVEVRATTGDNFLGGEDFSEALVDGFVAATRRFAGLDLKAQRTDLYALIRRQADLAKQALSEADEAQMNVPWEGQTLSHRVTRDDFEAWCSALLQRIRQPLVRALRDSGLTPDDIEDVVLAGGATRMPMVRNAVSRMFGRIPRASRNPDHVIAEGAAVMAGLLANDETLREVVMTDVCPYTLGTSVVVGMGTSHVENDVFSPIIDRNTIVPASRSQRFYTAADNQTVVNFPIYQGESRNVKHNTLLGEVSVPVPPRPRGEVSVDCRFTYDADGLLEVDVNVVGTGVSRQITILSQDSGLDQKDIALRREKLQLLKVHPRDQAENVHARARAERLYEECLGQTRELVGSAIAHFNAAIEQQDPATIRAQRARLTSLLDQIENMGNTVDDREP